MQFPGMCKQVSIALSRGNNYRHPGRKTHLPYYTYKSSLLSWLTFVVFATHTYLFSSSQIPDLFEGSVQDSIPDTLFLRPRPVQIVFFSLLLVYRTLLVAQMVKRLSIMQETQVRSLGWADHLEKEMAIHSSTIAWKIPWTRGAWQATVHGVTKSRTRLSDFTGFTQFTTKQCRHRMIFLMHRGQLCVLLCSVQSWAVWSCDWHHFHTNLQGLSRPLCKFPCFTFCLLWFEQGTAEFVQASQAFTTENSIYNNL